MARRFRRRAWCGVKKPAAKPKRIFLLAGGQDGAELFLRTPAAVVSHSLAGNGQQVSPAES